MNKTLDSRELLVNHLLSYRSIHTSEATVVDQIIEFVSRQSQCFERSCVEGHITGSAWIVSPMRTHVLLTHHRKLDKWLQLGGHADGEPSVVDVALQEAEEESGLSGFTLIQPEIFDVSVHTIPARKSDPTHLHFDIRYAFEITMLTPVVSDESHSVAWIPIGEMAEYNSDADMLRMLRKTALL